jgi:glutathione reductase (NADPH)
VVAVGGTPHKLDIPGADLTITSDEILELPSCPKKLVVFGGGYIAVEFAGIFARFGAEVHLVYRADMPLRGFDEEVRGVGGEGDRMKGRSVGGTGLG